MKSWIVSYVNINNDNTTIISQGREELLEMKVKVKQDITISRIREYITEWLEKIMGTISKTD